jgi:hypothetical protein
MRALMVSLVIAAASSTPALADFYIIQDATSKRCRVVEERPAPSEAITIGTAFRERAVAEERMRTVETCRDGTTGAGGAGVIIDEQRNEPRDRGNRER